MNDLQTILKAIAPKIKFREFVRDAWPLVEPARPFHDNWCIGAVCEHLQAVTDGQIKKLIINIPPGMAKSTLVSVMWGPYEWTLRPWLRWMFASHRMQLAFRDANRRRLIISSMWYREHFGHVYNMSGENLKYITNSEQGSMFSSSVDSQDVLGFRAHRLCLDDPHDPQGAISEVQRATTTEWLNLTWPTRKDDTPHSAEVLVMQRLHELDATGLYLKQGGWIHLKVPMKYKGKTFSNRDPRRRIGELIDEQIQSREYVEDKERRLGPWGEAAQYDQEPAPLGGGLIKASWLHRWKPSDRQPGYISIMNDLYHFDIWKAFRFCTVDLAMTEKTIGAKKLNNPDYTVMGAFACFMSTQGPALVLLDLIRERMEGPDTLPKLQSFHAHWKFGVIGVEDISEKMWYQQARRARLPVREISTSKSDDVLYTIDKDKVSRAMAATPLMASGRFHIPEYAPWLADFIAELTGFPNAPHDDCVDVVSSACAIAEKYTGSGTSGPSTENAKKLDYRHDQDSARHVLDGAVLPNPFSS